MTKINSSLRLCSLLFFGAFFLSACSTVSNITEAINPFDNGSEGEVTTDPERISILTLNDKLEVAGTILPSDIILPESYTNLDWAQTGGNATHTPQRTNARGYLTRHWSKGIGKGSSAKGRVIASPVVANGRIYAIDGANKIIALDAETGAKIWSYKVKVTSKARTRKGRASLVERAKDPLIFWDKSGVDTEAVGGGVAVANGRVFVTSGFGVMLALDAETGAEIWRNRTRTPMHSAPAIDGGRMFAVSDDNELFAVDVNTGTTLWTYQAIIETARMLTSPSPAVIDEVVIAPFSSGEIIALRVQNGGVLWQNSLNATKNLTPLATLNDIASGPVIADGYVFASTQSGSLTAFDFRTGQSVWTQPAGSLGFPLVVGNFLYIVTTEGEVVCMSKSDGTVIWLTQLKVFKNDKKRKKRIAWAGPIMTSNRLVVMGSNGVGIEIDPQNGQISNQFKLGGNVYISPIVANNTVYYITDKAKLTALK